MFILAVGIGLIFFYVVAQKTIDSSSQERMKTNVARQSEHLRTILNIHYSYPEGVAEKIAESNELMNEENKEVLTVFQKNTLQPAPCLFIIKSATNCTRKNKMEVPK